MYVGLKTLRMKDVPQVGGKNASLGQMISALRDKGVIIPRGFCNHGRCLLVLSRV